MKNTYTATTMMTNEELQEATIRLYVYNANKYTDSVTNERLVTYTGITAWDIISGGEEAAEIEADMKEDDFDDNHEYLVIHFNDGETSTYRNSRVDMFIR